MNKGYEPRSIEITPTNAFAVGTMNHSSGDIFWQPTKPKIIDQVDFKALEFAWEESEGSRLNPAKWLE